jgi:CRP/FNR family transcriptional regulator, cyclic AMP receptor protein
MNQNVTHSTLRDLAFTQGLDPGQLDQIARIASPVQWDAGATVFREGDCDSLLYLVEEGRVAIEITVPGRGRVIILTVGPGEVFGWSSIFHQRPKTASARTIEPAKALALDASRLRELCDADPRLGYLLTRRILGVVSERLRATRMQLLDIYSP